MDEDFIASASETWRLAPDEAARVELAIRALPPVECRILILSRVRGLSHAEIAREVGLRDEEVGRVLLRVLQTLAGAARERTR